jgi:hypothetical protein
MEKDKWVLYILISAGMKFRNKKKFQYDITACTGPVLALMLGKVNNKRKT